MIVDISHHKPVQDWVKVKKNVEFLISKATEGTTFIDSTLDSFVEHCEANKIPYWLYTFLNNGDELEQAKFLVSTCKKKVGSYFMGYVLDVESGNNAEDVKEAFEYIKKQSPKTMFYSAYADYNRYKSIIKNRGESCAYWEARYGKNNGEYDAKFAPHSDADLHQYTSEGVCPGIAGKVDLNRLTGNKKESWFVVGSDSAKPKATTKKKSNAEIVKEVLAGKWGNGEERKEKLTKAGYDYNAIQKLINASVEKPKTNSKTYVVKYADTLSSIAKRFGTTVDKIAKDNNLKNPNKIYIGQKLIIK